MLESCSSGRNSSSEHLVCAGAPTDSRREQVPAQWSHPTPSAGIPQIPPSLRQVLHLPRTWPESLRVIEALSLAAKDPLWLARIGRLATARKFPTSDGGHREVNA